MENKNLEFLDIISILSFVIGLQNLSLNETQVENLDKHLKEQDSILLDKILKKQNEMIDILKELKRCIKN